WTTGAPDRPLVTPNYPVFDAAGNLYVSDSGGWKENSGCVFRVAPDGATSVFASAVSNFPNGMAMHPSGSRLYSVVSLDCSIVSIDIGSDGSAGAIETIVELPNNVPDGLAFDEDGNLYISCYAPDIIYRVTPSGDLAVVA